MFNMIKFDDKSVKAADPHALFAQWLAEAQDTELNDPNAMALACCDNSGRISQRMVLLKGHEAKGKKEGFVFYTNLESDKGLALADNKTAALLFHWKSLRRQIRIEGEVSAVSAKEADAYFASRDRGSRIGAWVSQQSRPLKSRAFMQKEIVAAGLKYAVGKVPRPPYWSGFRLLPNRIEFWQDGKFRLHDRFIFTRAGKAWQCKRLYP